MTQQKKTIIGKGKNLFYIKEEDALFDFLDGAPYDSSFFVNQKGQLVCNLSGELFDQDRQKERSEEFVNHYQITGFKNFEIEEIHDELRDVLRQCKTERLTHVGLLLSRK